MTNQKLQEIELFAKKKMGKSRDPQHDFDHLERVAQNALKIVGLLKLQDKVDANLLQTICYLHDLTYVRYRSNLITYFFEGYLIRGRLREVYRTINIDPQEKKIIHQAIVKHPLSFPFKLLNKNGSLYTKILQDADTLDYFHELRIKKFRESHDGGFFDWFWKAIIDLVTKRGTENISVYLNFPEVADYFYGQNKKNQ